MNFMKFQEISRKTMYFIENMIFSSAGRKHQLNLWKIDGFGVPVASESGNSTQNLEKSEKS